MLMNIYQHKRIRNEKSKTDRERGKTDGGNRVKAGKTGAENS